MVVSQHFSTCKHVNGIIILASVLEYKSTMNLSSSAKH